MEINGALGMEHIWRKPAFQFFNVNIPRALKYHSSTCCVFRCHESVGTKGTQKKHLGGLNLQLDVTIPLW